MRILFANYRYFVSSGSERYMFNTAEALSARGHEIIPFSIRYEQNQPSAYEQYFVEPLAGHNEVFFWEHRWTPEIAWRTLKRLFYCSDVERAVRRLAWDTKPHVAYVLNYLRKLSPALLVGLKRVDLPIVVRLSDYAMLCPQPHCMRDERPCVRCVHGSLWHSVRYRCVKGSLTASLLNAVATWYHRHKGFFDLVDAFVTPSYFMRDLMLSAGFTDDRVRCIPSFVDPEVFSATSKSSRADCISYVGRMDPSKGVHVLIRALAILRRTEPHLQLRAILVGSGDPAYVKTLKQEVENGGLEDAVTFAGHLNTERVAQLLGETRVTVVPSLCYENLPNTILESYACGVPVLASDIGSLPECVRDGETGFLFRPGDERHLAELLLRVLAPHSGEVAKMSRQAQDFVSSRYLAREHVATLEALFADVMSRG